MQGNYRTNNGAYTMSLGVYLAFVGSRWLLMRLINVMAASFDSAMQNPVQFGLIALGTLLSYSFDRRSRPAQVVSAVAFRLVSSIMVRPYFKAVPWGREAADWLQWDRCRNASLMGSPASSSAGSESCTWPGKAIASFRIPDKKLKSRQRSIASIITAQHHLYHHRHRHHHLHHYNHQQQRAYLNRTSAPSATAPTSNYASAWDSPTVANRSNKQQQQQQFHYSENSNNAATCPVSPKSPLTFTIGGPRARSTNATNKQSSRRKSTTNNTTELVPDIDTPTIMQQHRHFDHLHSRSPFAIDEYHAVGEEEQQQEEIYSEHAKQKQAEVLLITDAPAAAATEELSSWGSQATSSLSSLTAILRPLLIPPTASSSLDYLKRLPSSFQRQTVSEDGRSTLLDDDTTNNAAATATEAGSLFFYSSSAGGVLDEVSEDASSSSSSSHVTMSRFRRHAVYHHQHPHPLVSPRRTSFDVVGATTTTTTTTTSSRHYIAGEVSTSQPSLRTALENCAYAARVSSPDDPRAYSALASVGLDGDCPASIRSHITDEHLLQMAALLGDTISEDVLRQLNIPPACSEQGTLCGAADLPNTVWEALLSENRPGLNLRAWRRPLRKGIFVYRSVVEIDGVDASDVRPFHLDDQARALWDDGALEVLRPIPEGCSRASRHAESCVISYLSKFPMPMAARRYDYARRVWHRPSDGGCYVICQSCDVAEEEQAQAPRAVQVLEFTSASVIQATPTGCQISTLYFEDSQVRPGLAKVAVPKGLVPFWSKYESALRLFAGARAVSHRHPTASTSSASNSLDGAANHFNDGSSDGEGSDDELYGALAELKGRGRRGNRRRNGGGGGTLDASSRWARRIVIAGAVKMMHMMMATR